jgi:hypothetical protein
MRGTRLQRCERQGLPSNQLNIAALHFKVFRSLVALATNGFPARESFEQSLPGRSPPILGDFAWHSSSTRHLTRQIPDNL